MKATTPTLILAATILAGSIIMSTSMIIAADKISFYVETPDDLDITLRNLDDLQNLDVTLYPSTRTELKGWGGEKEVPVPFPLEIQSQIGNLVVELRNETTTWSGAVPLKVQVEQ